MPREDRGRETHDTGKGERLQLLDKKYKDTATTTAVVCFSEQDAWPIGGGEGGGLCIVLSD